jgi:lauroyl/myristoyl acyltransferase
VAPRRAIAPSGTIDRSDLVTLAQLSAALVASLVTPRNAWPWIAHRLARLHARLSVRDLAATAAALNRAGIAVAPARLGLDLLTAAYLENIEAMSEYLPWHGMGDLTVEGAEHVGSALAAGRGVIFWQGPFYGNDVIGTRAFCELGFRVTHLRSYAHPFSATVFGQRVLNPLRNRMVDRHLAAAIVLEPSGGAMALQQMTEVLERNGIVSIAAVGAGKNAVVVPLLGGRLQLARGAMSLARRTGAAIVPTWFAYRPGPRYVLQFTAPLETAATGSDRDLAIAEAYAAVLAARLAQDPGNWRAWLTAHTWLASGASEGAAATSA